MSLVRIEYSLAVLIASGLASNRLWVEGRQPAVIGRYIQSLTDKKNLHSIYLSCSIREQAVRFIEREISHAAGLIASEKLPHREYKSLSDIADDVSRLPIPGISRITAMFQDNEKRDEMDRSRYQELYGKHPALDYRVKSHRPS